MRFNRVVRASTASVLAGVIIGLVFSALIITLVAVGNDHQTQVIEERVASETKQAAAKAAVKETKRAVANEVTEQLDDRLLPNNATPPSDPNNPFDLVPPTTLPAEGPFDLTTTTTGPPPGPIQPPPPPPDETTTTITIPEVPTTVTIPDPPLAP